MSQVIAAALEPIDSPAPLLGRGAPLPVNPTAHVTQTSA
jgi:hypothetical protein